MKGDAARPPGEVAVEVIARGTRGIAGRFVTGIPRFAHDGGIGCRNGRTCTRGDVFTFARLGNA